MKNFFLAGGLGEIGKIFLRTGLVSQHPHHKTKKPLTISDEGFFIDITIF